MGNHCRYLGESSNNGSRRHKEPICWKTRDHDWRNIAQSAHNVTTQVNVAGILNRGENINGIAHSLHVPVPEFISIVSQNRPVGISDQDWERFVSSITLGFCKYSIHNEQEKGAFVKNSRYAMSTPNSPSLSSIDAVVGRSMIECTPTLSETESVSSAEFAGRYILPDSSDHECSTSSTSMWSLNAESKSLSQLNWATARCLKQFSGADEVRAKSERDLKSRCTTLCLKDMPSNSYEENLFYDEDKMSTPARNPITDDGIVSTNKSYSYKKDVFDEIKVNLRVAQF